ncbi:MAG: MEDS domain-containing protein [Kutzneria sp.]|nr:MEDS domain-containing protein [Kutzneria sp.]
MNTTLMPADVDPFDRPALFYRDEQDYVAGTLPFSTERLGAGAPVAVAVSTANLTLLRDELGRDAEHVRLLDMTKVGRTPGRIIPGVQRAFADAHPGQEVEDFSRPSVEFVKLSRTSCSCSPAPWLMRWPRALVLAKLPRRQWKLPNANPTYRAPQQD